YSTALAVSDTAAADAKRQRRRRHRLIVDRLTVDDEERLIGAGERCFTADHHRCARTRLTGLRAHIHVWRFRRECGDDVLRLVGTTQSRAVDAIDRYAESFTGGGCTRARDHDFAEVERIHRQR